MPKAHSKNFLAKTSKEGEIKANRRLPNWVDLSSRGLFKDEIDQTVLQESVSWLASWKPVSSPLNLSYMKRNGDYEEEYVCKSKSWLAAKHKPYPKQRYFLYLETIYFKFPFFHRCAICQKRFIFPSYANFCYKYSEGLDSEKISDIQKVACTYHFLMKGVQNNRSIHKKENYKEDEDFDETTFNVDYDEAMAKETINEKNSTEALA